MSDREIFILDAQVTAPDGTVQQLTDEEAKSLMRGEALVEKRNMYVTITWIEGSPVQILHALCGYPVFEE